MTTARPDLGTRRTVACPVTLDGRRIGRDRDLTVTGGMAFAGGPYNNYVLQATCRMAELLRQGRGKLGLVGPVSGILTKQGFGLWSTRPPALPDGFRVADVTDGVAEASLAKPVAGVACGSMGALRETGSPSRRRRFRPRDGARLQPRARRLPRGNVRAALPLSVARSFRTRRCGSATARSGSTRTASIRQAESLGPTEMLADNEARARADPL